MIFNMVGAGGASDLSSIIATVESGSIVTCIKGATTLTGTSDGTVRFDDLENGTWTLKATKNGMSTTTTVNITKFQIYYITMSYFAATIAVTYPAGSTCTCSKGDTVLTAPDTSGSHAFVVPEAGEWIVKAVQGDDSATETVSITSNGQAETVELSYILIVYRPGTNWEANTGDYSSNRNTITYADDGSAYTITNDTADQGYVDTYIYTSKALDLTPYTTARIKMAVEHTTGAIAAEFAHAVQFASAQSNGAGAASTALSRAVGNEAVDKAIDISNLSGLYYFRIIGRIGDNVTIKYILNDIYCAK